MVRTFKFDDGQAWNAELTRVAYRGRETVRVGVQFWAAAAPDQRVIGRLPPQALVLSDAQLAEALRQALSHLSGSVELEG